jgi:hypothetical protein
MMMRTTTNKGVDMKTKKTKTKNTKNAVMYRDVVSRYFPLPKGMDPDDVNIERLIEKSIAKQARLTWVGDQHLRWDFKEDHSDAKTSTVSIRTWKNGQRDRVGYRGMIGNLQTKVGDLRVVVYNALTERCDYFLIPFKHISKMSTLTRKHVRRISFAYNVREDAYTHGLERFRRQSFAEICTVTPR